MNWGLYYLPSMKHLFVVLLGVFGAFGAMAQQSDPCAQDHFVDPFLDRMEGIWWASGTVEGEPVTYDVQAKWVLNHQFLELSMEDSSAAKAYAAKVMFGFDCRHNHYVVHWMDVFGGPFSETLGYGSLKTDGLDLRFNYPAGPTLNRFSYDPKTDTWISHMRIQDEEGKWETFGKIVFRRK